jgi:hypothetical protein
MTSNIQQEIKDLILRDLALLKLAVNDADRVWQYRDRYFLSGHYDPLFHKYIKEKKLK